METMRRLLVLGSMAALCALAATGCDPMGPGADEPGDTEGDAPAYLEFVENEDGWTLASARGARGDVVVPASYKGSPVTAVEESAFRESSITSVVVPASVTSMGSSVFLGCASLKSAEISASIARLPTNLFYGCAALERVSLPDGLTELGEHAFSSCSSLAALDLGDDLRTMERRSVYACDALTTLTLPASLETMHNYAVLSCAGLTELVMLGAAPPAIEADGVAAPRGVSTCGRLASIIVPSGEAAAAYKSAAGWSPYSGIIKAK